MTLPSLWNIGGGVTLTSDGDVGTLAGTGVGNGISQNIPGSLSTATYPNLLVRAKSGDSTIRKLDILVIYVSGAPDTFTMTGLGTAWQTFNFAFSPPAKTILSLTFQNQSVAGNILIDFIYPFKELLTLPSVLQPITFGKQRNIVELPVLGREGGVVQDLGSMTPDVAISGSLISTTSPNNYTADQWWQILVGLTLECGTVQADGNPTWQWLTTDQIQAKVLVKNFQPSAPMGRYQYWEYSLWLKQFDVIGESTVNLIGTPY